MAIITLGTNDAKKAFWDEARYAAEYVALIDDVRRANPLGEIALGLPVPQKGNKGEWIDRSVINVDVQKIVREVAAAAGVTRLAVWKSINQPMSFFTKSFLGDDAAVG